MINRLPKEFRLPAVNGSAKHGRAIDSAQPWFERLVAASGRCIARHPLPALGAALVTGIVVGRWVKR
jgi:hypothetical protein